MSEALYQEFQAVQDRVLVDGAPTALLAEMYNQLPDNSEQDSPVGGLIRLEYERRQRFDALRAAGPQVDEPTVEVIIDERDDQPKDFDGYFKNLVLSWIKEKQQAGERFLHQTIRIEAGAYRSSALSMRSDGLTTLHMDFYSAIRNGFGGLSSEDVADIKDKWL